MSSRNTSEMLRRAAKGEPPSNREIDTAIEKASASLERSAQEQPMSSDTRGVVDSAKNVLHDTQQFVMQRNAGEELQHIAEASQRLSQQIPGSTEEMKRLEGKLGISEKDKQKMKKEAQKGVNAARTVLLELIRSNDFRNVFVDTIQLLSEIFVQNVKGNIDTEQYRTKAERGARGERSAEKETKEISQKLKEDFENFQVEISDDQKRELKNRFHKILDKIAHNENFNQSINSLFSLFDEVRQYTDFWQEKAKTDLQFNLRRMYVKQIWNETKYFIEEFTGPKVTEDLLKSIKTFSKMILNDNELNQYFINLQEYIIESLENPELLKNDSHKDKVNDFIERGRQLMDKREYRSEVNVIFRNTNEITNCIREDPIVKQFASDIRQLLSRVVTDSNGRPQFKPELLSELKDVLVPLIIDQLQNVPMRPIVESGENYDYILDNIVFSGQDIIPAQITIESAMNVTVGVRPEEKTTVQGGKSVETAAPSDAVSGILIKVKDVRANLKDVNVWYHRKSFPEIEDTCKVNVDMGEQGADINLLLEIQNPQTRPVFKLHRVNCTVNKLNINVTESSANWLYNLLTSVFNSWIKGNIENGVEERVARFFLNMNRQLDKVMKSVDIPSMVKSTGVTESIKEPRLQA